MKQFYEKLNSDFYSQCLINIETSLQKLGEEKFKTNLLDLIQDYTYSYVPDSVISKQLFFDYSSNENLSKEKKEIPKEKKKGELNTKNEKLTEETKTNEKQKNKLKN